jgi:hypothetical protein
MADNDVAFGVLLGRKKLGDEEYTIGPCAGSEPVTVSQSFA